jgi:hypothetical protein
VAVTERRRKQGLWPLHKEGGGSAGGRYIKRGRGSAGGCHRKRSVVTGNRYRKRAAVTGDRYRNNALRQDASTLHSRAFNFFFRKPRIHPCPWERGRLCVLPAIAP